ncbi:MAG: sensor histidine kinase [Arcobacteraceae bacterium]|nr:sensor histidine kinase [Arcobacteraceae bacterium]
MLEKLSFRNRLLLSYLLYGTALVIVAIFTMGKISEENIKKSSQKEVIKELAEQKAFFDQYTKDAEKKLFAIRDSKIFKQYLSNNSDSNIVELFSYITNTSADIMQLRYLDKNGFEKIRIDRADYNSAPILIPNNKLQNKLHRYYFEEIIQLNDKEKSWYSKIDLNIEQGQIEKPIKPVLRVGIPVFVKNKKVGILIINIFMKYFLNKMSNLSLYNIYLIDKDGNFIIHPQKKYNWGKYLNTKYTVKNHFKDSYQKILNSDEYIGERLYSKLIDLDNGENIKMIFEPKFYKVQEQIQKQVNEMLFIMILMILLSFPVAYIFSLKFGNLKEKVDKLNDLLELKVEEKTKKLQELNETLEQRVKEEVDKNTQKEKQMLHQSRLAQMGEMISMIAHQWRQPLSAISSTAGVMKLDIMMGNYNKKFFEKSLDKISDYSQHLSSTIDDFRGFFKDNKEQTKIRLEDIIESSLEIIGSTLNSNNIKLVKNYECNEILNSYPNKLKQVVLNLIKNAEDVLLEHNIENPTIYLSTYKVNKSCFLEISDNAGGVPDDIMDKIFDPYFSTKKNKDGTGLGLYMSKTIIEEHCGGKLECQNDEDGAVFKIVFVPEELDKFKKGKI